MDDMRDLTFWGHKASEYGLRIGSVNVYNAGLRREQAYRVPGRPGDVLPEDAPELWPNDIREYSSALYLHGASDDTAARSFDRVRQWLLQVGYADLEDSYEPGIYRRAYLSGDFVPVRKGAGNNFEIPLTFSCDPRRYVVGQQETLLLSASSSGTRSPMAPADFACYPQCYGVLRVEGPAPAFTLLFKDYGEGTVYGSVTFAASSAGYRFDTETLECSEQNVVTDVSGRLYITSMSTWLERSATGGAVYLQPRWFVR